MQTRQAIPLSLDFIACPDGITKLYARADGWEKPWRIHFHSLEDLERDLDSLVRIGLMPHSIRARILDAYDRRMEGSEAKGTLQDRRDGARADCPPAVFDAVQFVRGVGFGAVIVGAVLGWGYLLFTGYQWADAQVELWARSGR